MTRKAAKLLVPDAIWRRLGAFWILNFSWARALYAADLPPYAVRQTLQICSLLVGRYGFLRSMSEGSCVDENGDPIPWYTYPAIEYLGQFDFSDKAVFEYGSGASSLWWAQRANSVISVEDSPDWYDKVRRKAPTNCVLLLEPDLTEYAASIRRFETKFDIIVIDGAPADLTRLHCAEHALSCLRPGGAIIFDNSDWHPKSTELLRRSGLIEVDFAGFTALNTCATVTSVFLSRDFSLKTKSIVQPAVPIGGVRQNWEESPYGPGSRMQTPARSSTI